VENSPVGFCTPQNQRVTRPYFSDSLPTSASSIPFPLRVKNHFPAAGAIVYKPFLNLLELRSILKWK
jgi:hypothetical protein